MKCPAGCTESLVIAERSGIEIDYCPTCRGVWLDRGELDKIIERNAAAPVAAAPPMPDYAPPPPEYRYDDRYYEDHRYYDDDDWKRRKKKKRGGFLEEIFDF